jgi:tetratricopeptide (TPR) repeat protein
MPRQKSTHVDSPEAVGRRLREAREKAGLSQRQLSFAGCSPAYISRIESGDRIPSLQLLRELGRRLGVSEDYLATGSSAGPGLTRDRLVEAEVALRLDDLATAAPLYAEALERAVTDEEKASALAGLGLLAFRHGDYQTAVERLERALHLYSADTPERFALCDSLGRAHAMLGQLDAATAVFESALAEAEAKPNALETIRFSVLLAYSLIDSGKFAKAEQHLARALELGEDSLNPSVRLQLYWSQARLYLEQNQPEEAMPYARRALEIIRLTEDSTRLARAHQLMAQIEIDRGNAKEGLRLLRDGWPLIAQGGNPVEQAHFRIEEARALAALGEKEEAAALAMELTGRLGAALPEDAGRAYTLLGDIFRDLGDTARAQELYELAVERLEHSYPTRYLVDAYTKLGELLEATGRSEEALALMRKALEIQRVALRA